MAEKIAKTASAKENVPFARSMGKIHFHVEFTNRKTKDFEARSMVDAVTQAKQWKEPGQQWKDITVWDNPQR
jgi:hypothetical protein